MARSQRMPLVLETPRLLDTRDFGQPSPGIKSLGWFGVAILLGVEVFAVSAIFGLFDLWDTSCGPDCLGGPARLNVLPVLGLFAYVVVVLLGLGGRRWWRWMRWRAADRRLGRAAKGATRETAAAGRQIRVRGTILPGVGFTSAGGRPSAVLVSYFGGFARVRGDARATSLRWELHGTDFTLALEGDERITVRVVGATLLGRPSRFPRRILEQRPIFARPTKVGHAAFVYGEDTFGPGDEIEVVGVPSIEVDPSGEPARRRDPPVTRVLASAPGSPLVVCRLVAPGPLH